MTRLVLDANIYIAASKSIDQARQDKCIEILQFILDANFRVVLNDELLDEWTRDRGEYVLMWQALMSDGSRLLIDAEPWPEEAALLAARPKNERAIDKDIHVIRASMNTDRRLLSTDKKLRGALRRALTTPGCPGALKNLHFVIPYDLKEQHDALDWLQRGAPEDPSLQLGA